MNALAAIVAVVTLLAVDARADLSPDVIRRVVQSHTAQLRECYTRELVRSPDLSIAAYPFRFGTQ